MRIEIFEQISIICPQCRKPEVQSALKLDSNFRKENDFVIDGFLFCPNPSCGTKYPILSGVPIIVKDIEKWVKPSTNDFLLSTYMESHYPETDSSDEFWKAAIDLTHSSSYQHALDLGCSVGRYTFELARCSKFALGIDLDFSAIAAAVNIQRTSKVTYKRKTSGRRYKIVDEPYSAPLNTLFIVADVLNPPLKANSFDVVAALNVLDNVTVPLILIGQMDALLKESGDLILSSPYNWQSEVTEISEWLETETFDSPEMLRKILTENFIPKMELKYEIQREFLDVAWTLRNHDRHWNLYLVHLLKARKHSNQQNAFIG